MQTSTELQILRQYSHFHSTPFAERKAFLCLVLHNKVHFLLTCAQFLPSGVRTLYVFLLVVMLPEQDLGVMSCPPHSMNLPKEKLSMSRVQINLRTKASFTVKGFFFHNVSGYCRFLNFTAAQQLLLKISLLNSGYFNFRMSVLTG